MFRQPKPYSILEHVKDREQFCIFHNDYGHTLAACRKFYNQVKSIMKKGELLKYLKKKIPVCSRKESWNSGSVTIKVATKGTSRNAEVRGSVQNLQIVSYVRKTNGEKEKKYEEYAARRSKRNLRTLALGHFFGAISKGKEIKASVPIVFTNEDLEAVNLPYADPLIIKLRVGNVIISRVLVDEGSSTCIIFWEAL